MKRRRKDDDLAPSPQFLAHAKNRDQPRAQYDQLMADSEMLRVVGVQLSRGDVAGAHRTVDEIAAGRRGTVRYADIHVKDIGVSERAARYLGEADIHTLNDLAHQDALKMVAHFTAVDALTITLIALRRVIELEGERA